MMRDGSLAVPTVGASSIRIFGPDGRFMREFGGPGQGPGEFRYLVSAWSRGDTIEAFDLGQQRVVRFLPGGSVGTVPFRGEPAGAFYGPLGPGWAVGRLNARMGGRDSTTVQLVSRIGADSVTRMDIAVTQGMHREMAPGISGPHPLTPTAIAEVHGDEIYIGETLTPLLRVYGADARLLREIPLPLSAPAGSAAAMRSVIDSATALPDDPTRQAPRPQWETYATPTVLSVFWAVIVDELGFIWVRPYDPIAHSLALDGMPSNRGGPGGRWLVLSPTGAQVGWIDVPDGFEPMWIGRDAIVGVYRDDLDVESVRVHRLNRR
jgi:hypothetical protein